MEANANIFEPVVIDSVAEAVVTQIEQLIISGVLKSGQKLPSERELAELMDVSRPKIRDAIKVLEDRGLLAVKHGDGTFVCALTGTALSPAMIDLYSRHPSAFRDYLEFRREVEGFAAYVAAQRATESDREIIRQLVVRMEQAHDNPNPVLEAEIDAGLHAAIVDAAHNSVLTHMMSSIYELMRSGVFYNRAFLDSAAGARDKLLDQHRAIADAVVVGAADDACSAAEAHLDFVMAGFRLGNAEEARGRIARKRLALFESAQDQLRFNRKRSKAQKTPGARASTAE